MADICDTCAFEDACPSAHFNKTESSICAFYTSMKKDKPDGTYWMEAQMKDEAVQMVMERLAVWKDDG